ncbi:MAG: helix-turn-helix domain-containing protein [Candidatus Thermoplasmatota archaeon]|nr:helix-turn-helix domain-containing protein [Candidatus Thermoplasmatota archaeon]
MCNGKEAMMFEDLHEALEGTFAASGFMYAKINDDKGTEFFARKDNRLLVISALERPKTLDRASASRLRTLSSVLTASPVLVTASSKGSQYQDGVLYVKFGIPLLTIGTLHEHLVDGRPPMVFFGPGRHYVYIDPDLLRSVREERGLSLGALSELLGVSRRAIQMYEGGMGVDLEIALELERILDSCLIQPLDPFSRSERLDIVREQLDAVDGLRKDVFLHLDSMGLEVIPATACPFDAIARDRDSILMTRVESDGRILKQRGLALSRISRITGERSLIIVRDCVNRKNIGGTAVVRVSELKRTDAAEDLIRIIEEREG